MTEDQIYRIFDHDGILSTKIDSFEFREGQLLMALDVLSAYKENALRLLRRELE